MRRATDASSDTWTASLAGRGMQGVRSPERYSDQVTNRMRQTMAGLLVAASTSAGTESRLTGDCSAARAGECCTHRPQPNMARGAQLRASPAQAASPLARRPYDLRHGCAY